MDRPGAVKIVLYGAGIVVGTIGLAVLAAIKVLDDCARRNGHWT